MPRVRFPFSLVSSRCLPLPPVLLPSPVGASRFLPFVSRCHSFLPVAFCCLLLFQVVSSCFPLLSVALRSFPLVSRCLPLLLLSPIAFRSFLLAPIAYCLYSVSCWGSQSEVGVVNASRSPGDRLRVRERRMDCGVCAGGVGGLRVVRIRAPWGDGDRVLSGFEMRSTREEKAEMRARVRPMDCGARAAREGETNGLRVARSTRGTRAP